MKNYSLFPEFILRTPLLPIDPLFQTLASQTEAENLIGSQFHRAEIREALFIGSPNLHAAYQKWESGQSLPKKEVVKLHAALLRYLTRMSTRCTPFGLFAGTHVGEWAKDTNVQLGDLMQHRRHTRLDMLYLCNLAQKIANDPAVRPLLKFYPNNSIYALGDQLRYIEYYYHYGNRRYEISSVQHTDYLVKLLQEAATGKYLSELAELLVDDEVSLEEAQEFVDEITDHQLLVSELEPAITGEEFLNQLLALLARLQSETEGKNSVVSKLHDCLTSVRTKIESLDSSLANATPTAYEDIAQQLESLEISTNMKYLFQVDLVKEMSSCKLSNRLAGNIRKGIEVLNRLNPHVPHPRLNRFRDVFLERYETEEIPILQALDNETGIGYLQYGDSVGDITPLIDDVPIPKNETGADIKWSSIQQFLLQKYSSAIAEQAVEVVLTDEELRDFPLQWDDLPDTLTTMAVVLDSTQQSHRSDLFLKFAGGSSAINLVGRFTHADPRMTSYARKLAERESELNPDVIYAEIIHLPQNRTGNILLRRQLRKFEIPFLTPASVPEEDQIQLADLSVSVRSGRIVLWSGKHNKEVIPRLSTAHNFTTNALPIYQFLCDLQSQHKRLRLGFYWGAVFPQNHFLPRVRYRNLILHRKTWQFSKEKLSFLQKLKNQALESHLKQWRAEWKIPRYILLVDHDNELFIDLESKPYLDMFVGQIKKFNSIVLKESLFNSTNTVVKDSRGQHYTNELIMAFVKQKNQVPVVAGRNRMDPTIQRQFIMGSEWLYYKIYLGPKMGDQILTQYLAPLANLCLRKGWIDSWFFIRYQDPRFHIRIRFHLTDTKYLGGLVGFLAQQLAPLLEEKLIWKLQSDTYRREVERYGSNSIELAEELFFHDSTQVVRALQLLDGIEDEEEVRWLYTLKTIDTYLDAFQFTLSDKANFSKNSSIGFAREFRTDKTTHKKLGQKFRDYRKSIVEVMEESPLLAPIWQELFQHLHQYKQVLQPIGVQIRNKEREGSLEPSIDQLIWSLIHMLVNRLSRSKARKNELVLHHMLAQHYASQLARHKADKQNSNEFV